MGRHNISQQRNSIASGWFDPAAFSIDRIKAAEGTADPSGGSPTIGSAASSSFKS